MASDDPSATQTMKTTLILAAGIAAIITSSLAAAPNFTAPVDSNNPSFRSDPYGPRQYRKVSRTTGILTGLPTPNGVHARSLHPNQALVRTTDRAFADPQWHRVPGAPYLVARCIPSGGARYVTETAVVGDAWRYPLEQEPTFAWSKAFAAFVPYPVDDSNLAIAPATSRVGYSSIDRVTPSAPQDPVPQVSPIVAKATPEERIYRVR